MDSPPLSLNRAPLYIPFKPSITPFLGGSGGFIVPSPATFFIKGVNGLPLSYAMSRSMVPDAIALIPGTSCITASMGLKSNFAYSLRYQLYVM